MALAKSIEPWGGHVHILLLDRKNPIDTNIAKNTSIYELKDVSKPMAVALKKKYKADSDNFRWSLKPVFLDFLLNNCLSVIYVDNDIYFFDDYQFLFEDLKQYDILLSPHHYPADPEKNQNWLEANFRVGLYNAGFVGANQNAKETLAWWAKCCLYRCEKNYFRGLFDDQKYLDLVPILHPNTKVLEHKGCNVAEWNALSCVKSEMDSKILINQEFPLIFYHFNNFSLQLIEKNSLIFQTYFQTLKKFNSKLEEKDLIYKTSIVDRIKLSLWKILNKINEAKTD